MRRRKLLLLWAPVALAGMDGARQRVRGRLSAEAPPALKTRDGRRVLVEGDEASMAVVRDPRVIGEEFEAVGTFVAADRFRIDPIHERAMFVVRGGKALVITYWCEVCAIRTYSLGPCQCCQEETELDPREPGSR